MTIDVPDEWRRKFEAYGKAELLLRENWHSTGVSHLIIARMFAAFGGVNSCWKDPAFRVWAALRGCVQASDFFRVWQEENEQDTDQELTSDLRDLSNVPR